MEIVTKEDMEYLVKQPAGQITIIISGMTTLMSDTVNKVTAMEEQGWFQRMVKTVTGKNKLALREIQQNHDKLNLYMAEAIAGLYKKSCIEENVIMSLATRLNELYAGSVMLKQMLGSFVNKLNEKIDSIDNFHMLIEEINQGVYSCDPPIIAICKVLSQIDHRTLESQRKLDIIKRSLSSQGIIASNYFPLMDYFVDILETPIDKIGQVYLELGTIHENFVANVMLCIMENYYFQPGLLKDRIDKKEFIEGIVRKEGVDSFLSFSINELYSDFIYKKIDVRNRFVSKSELYQCHDNIQKDIMLVQDRLTKLKNKES